MKKITISSKFLAFLNNDKWILSKIVPNWPHEYIVRDLVDDAIFFSFVEYIRALGAQGYFFSKKIKYLDDCGLVYWTTGTPVIETIIIYRCLREYTYDYRLANGTLPD